MGTRTRIVERLPLDVTRALVSFSKLFDLGYTVLLLPLVDMWETGYGRVHMSGRKIMGTS